MKRCVTGARPLGLPGAWGVWSGSGAVTPSQVLILLVGIEVGAVTCDVTRGHIWGVMAWALKELNRSNVKSGRTRTGQTSPAICGQSLPALALPPGISDEAFFADIIRRRRILVKVAQGCVSLCPTPRG